MPFSITTFRITHPQTLDQALMLARDKYSSLVLQSFSDGFQTTLIITPFSTATFSITYPQTLDHATDKHSSLVLRSFSDSFYTMHNNTQHNLYLVSVAIYCYAGCCYAKCYCTEGGGAQGRLFIRVFPGWEANPRSFSFVFFSHSTAELLLSFSFILKVEQ